MQSQIAKLDCDAQREIAWHKSKVAATEREKILQINPATVWLTGLSGSGKSTLAFELEQRIIMGGRAAFVLDGDNVRHGLSRDLGFSQEDRKENIRRIAEVAKLFNDAGMLVITAFISPFRQDREMAREIIGCERFIETHVCADIHTCESRDPKGLYKKVRNGNIAEFTGISSPYEEPLEPDLRINTSHLSVDESVLRILDRISFCLL